MSALEQTCPYCGDSMESVGTLNHIECVREQQATIDEWQQMYREMHAAAEHLRERLLCMAPSDTEAKCLSLVERITELEAELAALNERRCCKDCGHWGEFLGLLVGTCDAVGRFSSRNYLETPDTFSCRWWTARADEGSES